MLSTIKYPVLVVVLLGTFTALSAGSASVRGRLLVPEEGQAIQLLTDSGRTLELAIDELLDHTMRDPQLARRVWELRGREAEVGKFEVDRAFTIKDGKRYRVTYYCEICHITTYEPGRCMCCQDDTELREILDD